MFYSDASKDHQQNDCFVCFILTHGRRLSVKSGGSPGAGPETYTKEILYAQDGGFELNEVKKCFEPTSCPTLVGKPKLFFIQVNFFILGLASTVFSLNYVMLSVVMVSFHRKKHQIVCQAKTKKMIRTTETSFDFLHIWDQCDFYWNWKKENNIQIVLIFVAYFYCWR